jgi:pimeloyl-ACP methyl ester carboxylesterase
MRISSGVREGVEWMRAVLQHEARTRKPTWTAAVSLATLLSISGVVVTGTAAAANGKPTGSVLSSATASVPSELAPLATGKRIAYVTTDVRGASITATGLVLTPKKKKKNKTVVWGHGTTGLADKCAPSDHQEVFWPEARAALAQLLKRGWTVTAPDYPGLGTPAAHPYLVGGSAGRSMIDSVRAARNLDSGLSVQYVLDGHSQGGQGALFGGELAPSYDGPLVLRGVAAVAPASNVDLLAPEIPGTPAQGYLVMALYGLHAVEPGFNPQSVLAGPAKQRLPVLQSGCLYKILDAYDSLTKTELLVGGALPQSVIDKLALYDNPAQSASSAPILVVQGTADEAVPYTVTAQVLIPQLNAYDQPVQYVEIAGASHDGAVFDSVETVASWIAARFG